MALVVRRALLRPQPALRKEGERGARRSRGALTQLAVKLLLLRDDYSVVWQAVRDGGESVRDVLIGGHLGKLEHNVSVQQRHGEGGAVEGHEGALKSRPVERPCATRSEVANGGPRERRTSK